MRILSMMSGTSTDGISWVIADLEEDMEGIHFHIIESGVHKFMPHVRDELLLLTNSGEGSLKTVNSAHWNLGRELIRAAGKMKNKPEIAVFSGHTLYHAEQSGGVHGGTFQIGAVEPLSVYLNVPVISDFRSSDVAAGGMGAPLVPLADSILFGPDLLVLNIGGISNVSFTGENIAGFDLGPGNMLLDGAMKILFKKEFDQDGTIALSGKIIHELLNTLMEDEFVNANPPKSCGRERFGSHYL
ncbi:MAG: anhydro-N-acetylmuramic acid kinase, partial [Thermoplasmatales archaeon]|nr:anhydro-N-acetylmuramic acid kinase [Thermoplasmatales archaeon]